MPIDVIADRRYNVRYPYRENYLLAGIKSTMDTKAVKVFGLSLSSSVNEL